MMGYQDNIEFYLKMSRKEVQQLCRRHNLPTNRSHAQLAKSLFSLFKKRNACSSVSQEKLVNFMDASSKTSFVSEPKSKQTVNSREESTRGLCGRPNSFKLDINGQSSGANEIPDDDISLYQISSQMEVIGRVVNITSEKAQTSTKALSPLSPTINKGTEGFGSSTTDHCHIGMRSSDAASVQEIRTKQLLSLECKELGTRSDSGTSLGLKNADQKLIQDAITNRRNCKTVPILCEHNRPQEYSMESGFVSAGEISVRIPSLQFFVMSEGGINLHVDLSSSPLEWVSSLKDGVCVHQNAEHHESVSLSKDISNSPEVDDDMKISPFVDTAMDLQGIVVDQDTGCTNSSLGSFVSENCNSEAYPPDTTMVTSGSSVLTSGSAPAGLSGHLEVIQIVSSSCAAYAVQNCLTSDIEFCPQEVVDPVHASFEMVKSNASLPDASANSTTNMDNGAITPIMVGVSTTKTSSADFIAVENNAVSDTPNNISDKNNLPVSNEIEDNTDTSNYVDLKNHNGAEASFMECTNELPDNANLHEGLLNSYQLDEQMVLDGPMADAQSEVGVADGPFHQQACSNCGTLVPEHPVSMFHDESVQTTRSAQYALDFIP